MRSSAMPSRLPPPRERAAYKTGATYVRKLRGCCSRARPPPPRIRHSAWRKLQCCPAHPIGNPDSPSRRRLPSPSLEKDLPPRLPPCVPSAHPAQCPPSAKTSSGCRRPRPPSPRREKLSPQSKDPKSSPVLAEWENPF